jgi:hypothetical protein
MPAIVLLMLTIKLLNAMQDTYLDKVIAIA